MRAKCLVFHASRHGAWSSRMTYAFRPVLFASSFPPRLSVAGIYRRVDRKRVVSYPRSYFHIAPQLFCRNPKHVDRRIPRFSVARLFLQASHRGSIELLHRSSAGGRGRLLRNGPVPSGYFGKDKVPASPALIGHEQVTYVKFDQVGAAIFIVVVSLPMFSLSLPLSLVFPRRAMSRITL